jgi:hypothetical protein
MRCQFKSLPVIKPVDQEEEMLDFGVFMDTILSIQCCYP